MNKNRRRFLQASLAGTAVAAAGAPHVFADSHERQKSGETAKILVLGGTGFIGPHMVREALRRGHEITLFNRGKTNNTLFPDIELLVGDAPLARLVLDPHLESADTDLSNNRFPRRIEEIRVHLRDEEPDE